jgi:hypothetical protein
VILARGAFALKPDEEPRHFGNPSSTQRGLAAALKPRKVPVHDLFDIVGPAAHDNLERLFVGANR